jgi:hypothetical protein
MGGGTHSEYSSAIICPIMRWQTSPDFAPDSEYGKQTPIVAG